MICRAIIYLLIILCIPSAFGGVHDIAFSHIGIEKGLSHATVNGITQDSYGYVWVATPDGLNRYDGFKFVTFYPDSVDHNIRAVASDEKGSIWAVSANTLSHYCESDETFVCYPFTHEASLNTLLPINAERIALGTTGGAYIFDISERTFTLVEGSKYNSVTALTLFDGKIAAGTTDGQVLLFDGSEVISRITLPVRSEINIMLADRGALLVGTEGSGLYVYTPSTGVFTHIGDGHGIDYVRSLLVDWQKRLWVGTFTGLYVFDADRRRVVFHENATADDGALSHSSVRRMFADRDGGIWLGTYFGGLNYYHPLSNQFTTLSKHSSDGHSISGNVAGPMAEDKSGNIWIGTNNGGLNIYNPAAGDFRKLSRADGLGSDDIKAIFIDENGHKAYVGTHTGGLSTITLADKRVVTNRAIAQSVYDIIPAIKDGCFWLATLDGVTLFDTRTGNYRRIFAQAMPQLTTGLMRDSDNRLWVSGEYGLAVYAERDGELELLDNMPKMSRHINDVYQARNSDFYWISTHRGLYCYNGGTGSMTRYDINTGLPGDIVYATLEDPNGQIWATTNRGLACLNPRTGIVMTYNNRDGLKNSQFTDRSALSATNGLMYFGGIDGVTYFNPSILEKNTFITAPVIEGVRLFNEPVVPGDDSGVLDAGIHRVNEIKFNSSQTNFTIDFTVCDYLSKGDNTFSYMLDGLDRQWITLPHGVRSVSYSNLPSGKYTFRLRVANNDGVWSDDEAALKIVILPPWYLTWWAITLAVLLCAGIAILAVRYFWLRKSREKQQKTQQEVNEMKVRFFVNMSHELRTPLTLMLLPVNELIGAHPDPATLQKLTTIRNNTLRIRHIVDQLLDYRRAELGMFKLSVAPVGINTLMNSLLEPYGSLAENKRIRFNFNSALPQDERMYVDSNYIELIVNNLVTNAFKYTPEGGMITVDMSQEDEMLKLDVTDTGCGIPADKLNSIFVRFYQLDDSAAGYGIGLSLVKHLVELHHGTITVKSEVGHGSTFTVMLPAKESFYVPAEISSEQPGLKSVKEDVSVLLPMCDEPERDVPENNDGRKTVMVVDDNAEILKYLSNALSGTYRVLTAANGAKAIEHLGADSIDLVISDVMMPDIDGVQLCRTIKRNLRTSHIPVILLSAKADVADRLDGLNVGADDYIAKPFQMELLLAKIRNQIRTRESIILHYSQNPAVAMEPASVAQNPLDEEFLSKAVKVMNDHLDDSQFTTDEFAREMCMSRSNLHLKMKALTGESTNDFIRRTRLRKASELLKTRRYTVAEVSAMVGYSTPSYFATAFKNFFGHSPSSLLAQP